MLTMHLVRGTAERADTTGYRVGQRVPADQLAGRAGGSHVGHGTLCYAGRHYSRTEWHCRCGEAVFVPI